MNQKSTKEKIIDMSLNLFNSQGVENITTRHIAKKLNISQGNLHYHYPNKDKILERLFSEFLTEIKNAEQILEENLLDSEHTLQSMKTNFRIMYTYRLFFQQNDVIWRRVPEIKEAMQLLFQTKQSEIITLLSLHQKSGNFRKEISSKQIEFLAEQFIFNIQSWLNVKVYNNDSLSYEYYAKHLFRLWLPYLNSNQIHTWEKLLD